MIDRLLDEPREAGDHRVLARPAISVRPQVRVTMLTLTAPS